jgi:hypothetical protein
VLVLCLNLGNIHLPLPDKKQAGFEIVGRSCQCSVLVRSGDCNYFCIGTTGFCFTASLRNGSSFIDASIRSDSSDDIVTIKDASRPVTKESHRITLFHVSRISRRRGRMEHPIFNQQNISPFDVHSSAVAMRSHQSLILKALPLQPHVDHSTSRIPIRTPSFSRTGLSISRTRADTSFRS